MVYRWLTDLTIAFHFGFILFVVAGGIIGRRYRWLTVAHLSAVIWAVYVEATPGLVCPLTPLENYFAVRAGRAGYEGSFIAHYLVPIIYPDGLTRGLQLSMAALVLFLNIAAYFWPSARRWWKPLPPAARGHSGIAGT